MEQIVKIETEAGRKLIKASQDSLMNDLRGQFVHEGKVLIQEKMRLEQMIVTAQEAIALVERKLAAIENGKVSFDLRTGKIMYPAEVTGA